MRNRLENALIATLNQDSDFFPSPIWLGNYSPQPHIRESGLWLKNGLFDIPITRDEIQFVEAAVIINS
jgi:hypothetical protein